MNIDLLNLEIQVALTIVLAVAAGIRMTIWYLSHIRHLVIMASGKSKTLQNLHDRRNECINTGDMDGYRELSEAISRLDNTELVALRLFSKLKVSFDGSGSSSPINVTEHRGRLFRDEQKKQCMLPQEPKDEAVNGGSPPPEN